VQGKKLDFFSAKYSSGKRRLGVLRLLLLEKFPTQIPEVPLRIAEEIKMARS